MILGNLPRPLNVPLLRALWSPLVGIWGLLKGSWGVLVESDFQVSRLGGGDTVTAAVGLVPARCGDFGADLPRTSL